MEDLTSLQRDALVVIGGMPEASGVEIIDELEDYYESELFGGRLYPGLDGLIEQGFLEKSSRDGRTNSYRLTAAGQQLLKDRLEWQAGLLATE